MEVTCFLHPLTTRAAHRRLGGVIAGPCFYPLCTNTTNWFYNGLITIGVEKASQWTNNFGSLDMQMMPLAHDRCIPVAYTSVLVCTPTSIYPPTILTKLS